MKVVILCGGAGSRLAEETQAVPKPMVEIGGRPILWHIMKLYAHHGFTEFILCLGYKGDLIREFFLQEHGWRVVLAETGLGTPTGGRIKAIERYVRGETFLATYGDGVGDVRIDQLVSFHRSHRRIATVTGVHRPPQFGEMDVDGDRVVGFHEKPPVGTGWVNGGFFAFEPAVFAYLDAEIPLERGPLERLVREEQLMVFRHEGYWHHMDTIRDRQILEEQWATGTPGWKVW